jgi:hypothetical protein
MRLVLFLTADYANVTDDGKLNVMGIFSEINAVAFPARHPSMHLVISLAPDLGEFGETRNLVVLLQDADGNKMLDFGGPVTFPKAQGGKKPQVNAILQLKDVVFPGPGGYQFVVLVDKDYKGDHTLFVNQIAARQG